MHIADVSSVVAKGSPLQMEARGRAASLYAPTGTGASPLHRPSIRTLSREHACWRFQCVRSRRASLYAPAGTGAFHISRPCKQLLVTNRRLRTACLLAPPVYVRKSSVNNEQFTIHNTECTINDDNKQWAVHDRGGMLSSAKPWTLTPEPYRTKLYTSFICDAFEGLALKPPRSCQYGIYKTVEARFLLELPGKSP